MPSGAGRIVVGTPARRHADVFVDVGGRSLWPAISGTIGHHSLELADVETLITSEHFGRLAAASLVIVGSRVSNGAPSDTLVQQIHARLAHLPILICSRGEDRTHLRVRHLSLAGADALFVIDSPVQLRSLANYVHRRALAPVPERVLFEIASLLPRGDERTWVLWCIRNANFERKVPSFEQWFGVDRAVANPRIEALTLPPIGTLLRLGRAQHGRELRRRGVSPGETAHRLGFASAKALSTMVARLLRSPHLRNVDQRFRDVLLAGLRHDELAE